MTNTASERPAVLRADGLVFGYAKPALFNGLSLSLLPGVTWIGGDESTGKTTLLRLLAAELSAKSGTLQVNGVPLNAQQVQAYQREVFWVDPRTQAFDALTPQAYWDGVRKRYPAFADRLLADLIEGLGLTPHVPKSLYMLSTGTRRKVYLAAALASGAAVTLLDEPFAALDKASIAVVLELLQAAADHPSRAWVVADYVAPPGVVLAGTVELRPLA